MKHAGAIQRRISGHSLSTDDDAEQGTPSVATEGESTEVEEEPNRNWNEWLKAMNRDSQKWGIQTVSRNRETKKWNSEPREED